MPFHLELPAASREPPRPDAEFMESETLKMKLTKPPRSHKDPEPLLRTVLFRTFRSPIPVSCRQKQVQVESSRRMARCQIIDKVTRPFKKAPLCLGRQALFGRGGGGGDSLASLIYSQRKSSFRL